MADQWVKKTLTALDEQLGVEPKGEKEERWIDCPNCGTEAEKEHCSYGPRGWHCFVCGEGGGLKDLSDRLGAQPASEPYRKAARREKKAKHRPFFWQQHAEEVLTALTGHPKVEQHWALYRPFNIETIRAWNLGVGTLPSCRCKHRRLIYPSYDAAGRVIAFRGRAFECDCTKWLQSAGSRVTLWGGLLIKENTTVIVCESPIDAMLAMQETPGIVAVASTGGAGTWRESWTKWIRDQRPKQVVVWYDNDLPGTPNEVLRYKLAQEWRDKHPQAKKLPVSNGPRVANALRKAGVNAVLYKWPDGAPEKADLSWALMEGLI